MELFFIYLLKSSSILGLFYITYFLFLRKETFIFFNRYFLIGGIFTSVLIPFIKYIKIIEASSNQAWQTTQSFDKANFAPIASSEMNLDLASSLLLAATIIYSLGVIAFISKTIINVYSFFSFIKPFHKTINDEFIYVKTDKDLSPFSFLNYIVFNPNQFTTNELENILKHEKEHSSQKHTYDILLMEFFRAFQWINPFVWMYKKAIVHNLEFLADNKALTNVEDESDYQLTLLKTISSRKEMQLTNNFFDSLIKNRINMLNKAKSNNMKIIKSLVIIPLLALFVFQFNTKVVAQYKSSQEEINNKLENPDNLLSNLNNDEELTSNIKNEKEVHSNMLYFLDGIELSKDELEDKLSYLNANTRYGFHVTELSSEEAVEKYGSRGINGASEITLLKDNLDIIETSSGRTKEYIKQEKSEIKESELTIKPISKDTKISPPQVIDSAKVKQTYKVGLQAQNINAVETNNSISFMNSKTPEPLIVLDGKIISSFEMSKIKTKDIKQMSVLKGDKAVEKYGKSAVGGAIEIVMFSEGTVGMEKLGESIIVVEGNDAKEVNLNEVANYYKPSLYILNNTEVSKNELSKINKDEIIRIELYKSEKAIRKFGERAKDGAIVVITGKK